MGTDNIREINIEDWELSGEGGTAESYFHKTDDSVVLKLFTGDATGPEYADQELAFSKNVEKCGLSTSKAIEKVKYEDRFGIIYERIKDKKSFSRLCADDPKHIEDYAKMFAKEAKALHSLKCSSADIVSRAEQMERIAADKKKYSPSIRKKIKKFLKKYPQTNTCLHGDLQSGNIIQAEGKNYWIDLGTFAYGNPIFDLAGTYFFYRMLPGRIYATGILHMNLSQLKRFWDGFIDEYLSDLSDKEKKEYIEEIRNGVCMFLIYTADYEDHTGFEGLALKVGLEIVTRLAKI